MVIQSELEVNEKRDDSTRMHVASIDLHYPPCSLFPISTSADLRDSGVLPGLSPYKRLEFDDIVSQVCYDRP